MKELMEKVNLKELNFKKFFVTGLVVAVPLFITLYVVYLVIFKLGGVFGKILGVIPPFNLLPSSILTLLSLVLLVAIVYLLGLLTTTFMGNKIIEYGDRTLSRLPLIRTVYTASKQLTETLLGERKVSFRKVVMIEFPRPGSYVLGFLTNENLWEIKEEGHLSVFVPTAPNPTSGWFLIVKKDEIVPVDISVEEALKIIVSGGIIHPSKEGGPFYVNKKFIEEADR